MWLVHFRVVFAIEQREHFSEPVTDLGVIKPFGGEQEVRIWNISRGFFICFCSKTIPQNKDE